ncbi:MAG: hypothetical protein L3J71_08090 [Victivallaceae bacterium]|nr:hypothetical protein [Victivallaceae bacterium]
MIDIAKRLEILKLHSDPVWGSPYWIEFFSKSTLTIEAVAEHPLIMPAMDPEVLRNSPLERFIPKKVIQEQPYLITGETSGFSGKPIMTVFSEPEFETGFVTPFLQRAMEVDFPVRGKWLWAGPSGPHIVGKAIRAILKTAGGFDPFTLDFDPRWYKRLPENSMSRERYFKHIEEQLFAIINTQKVDVLFSTPPVIRMLTEKMAEPERHAIRGVHYGGISTDYSEYQHFKAAFPNAVHLNGYGNSLFGVFLEASFEPDGIEYSTASERVELELVKNNSAAITKVAVGETGQVMLSRYDESFMIINMLERDIAVKTVNGIRNPHPEEKYKQVKVLY